MDPRPGANLQKILTKILIRILSKTEGRRFEVLIHFDVLLFVLLFVLCTLVLFKVGIVNRPSSMNLHR